MEYPVSSPDAQEMEPFMAIANSDYNPGHTNQKNELEFKKGEKITVGKTDDSGWWEGRIGGTRHGWFPSSYVDVVIRRRQKAHVNEPWRPHGTIGSASALPIPPEVLKETKDQTKAQPQTVSDVKKKRMTVKLGGLLKGSGKKREEVHSDESWYSVHWRNDLMRKLSGFLKNRPTREELNRLNILIERKQVFGVPLEDTLVSFSLAKRHLPTIVEKCVQFLDRKGIHSEGLFRISPNALKLQEITMLCDQEFGEVDFDSLPEVPSVHVVASLLKQYFRSLPDPPLTFHLYDAFVLCMKQTSRIERIQAIREVVERLPEENRNLMEFVLPFLQRCSSHQARTKMSVQSLSLIFSASFLRARAGFSDPFEHLTDYTDRAELVKYLIVHFNRIFLNKPDEPVSSPCCSPLPCERSDVRLGIAQYSFKSSQHGELSVEEGDLVFIYHEDPSGWWDGEFEGTRGVLPGAYFTLIHDNAFLDKPRALDRWLHVLDALTDGARVTESFLRLCSSSENEKVISPETQHAAAELEMSLKKVVETVSAGLPYLTLHFLRPAKKPTPKSPRSRHGAVLPKPMAGRTATVQEVSPTGSIEQPVNVPPTIENPPEPAGKPENVTPRPEKPARPEKPERLEKPENLEKVEKPVVPPKPKRLETTPKPDILTKRSGDETGSALSPVARSVVVEGLPLVTKVAEAGESQDQQHARALHDRTTSGALKAAEEALKSSDWSPSVARKAIPAKVPSVEVPEQDNDEDVDELRATVDDDEGGLDDLAAWLVNTESKDKAEKEDTSMVGSIEAVAAAAVEAEPSKLARPHVSFNIDEGQSASGEPAYRSPGKRVTRAQTLPNVIGSPVAPVVQLPRRKAPMPPPSQEDLVLRGKSDGARPGRVEEVQEHGMILERRSSLSAMKPGKPML